VGRPDVDPGGGWYRETGQGMGSTLVTAAEAGGYTLTDRGTFLATAVDGDLAAHVDRGLRDPPALLRNDYAVIPVNPARHDVAYQLSMAYVGHLTGSGRAAIDEFRIDGRPGFRSVGASSDPRFGQYVPSDWRR
jgi:tungstate transport system substrate-binding protein